MNVPEAAVDYRIETVGLLERPIDPLLQFDRGHRMVGRGSRLDRRDIGADFLRLLQRTSLCKEPADARLFQTFESLAFQPLALRFLASFFGDELFLPLDDVRAVMFGARAAHAFTVHD